MKLIYLCCLVLGLISLTSCTPSNTAANSTNIYSHTSNTAPVWGPNNNQRNAARSASTMTTQ